MAKKLLLAVAALVLVASPAMAGELK